MYNEKYIPPQENIDDILSQAHQGLTKLSEELFSNNEKPFPTDEELKSMTPEGINGVLKKSNKELRDASHFSVSEFNRWREIGNIQGGIYGTAEMSAEGSQQRLQYLFNNSPIWTRIGDLQHMGKVEVKFVIKGPQLYVNITSRNLSGSEGYDIPIIVDRTRR